MAIRRRPLRLWQRARSRWSRLRIPATALGLSAALLATLTWSGPTADLSIGPGPPPAVPAAGAYFGALADVGPHQTGAQAVATMETDIGRPLAVDRSYSRWDSPQPSTIVGNDAGHGRIPILSITPRRVDGSKVSWAAIAAGTQDGVIRAQADGLRDLGVPMIVVFQHEPDLAVGYGSPAQFIAAYRHYVTVFRAERATNVAFGFVLTSFAYGDPSRWYPGDSYVDWIGVDVYNSAGCRPGLSGWRSLATAGATFYQWGSTRGKPLMLSEWGSAEDPTRPGRKAAWLRAAASTIAGWTAVKAVAYFDHVGNCDWRLDTSASAESAFTQIAHESWADAEPPVAATPAAAAAATSSTAPSSTAPSSTAPSSTAPSSTPSAAASMTGFAPASVATAGARPAVTEGVATKVTDVSAVVPAMVDMCAQAGRYYIEWGSTLAYGSRTPTHRLTAADDTAAVSRPLTGLSPGTVYHWRLVATSASGTTVGADRTFATLGH